MNVLDDEVDNFEVAGGDNGDATGRDTLAASHALEERVVGEVLAANEKEAVSVLLRSRRNESGDAQGLVVKGPLEDVLREREGRVEDEDLIGGRRSVARDARVKVGCASRRAVSSSAPRCEEERRSPASRSVQFPAEGSFQSAEVGSALPKSSQSSPMRTTRRACGSRSGKGRPMKDEGWRSASSRARRGKLDKPRQPVLICARR